MKHTVPILLVLHKLLRGDSAGMNKNLFSHSISLLCNSHLPLKLIPESFPYVLRSLEGFAWFPTHPTYVYMKLTRDHTVGTKQTQASSI